MKQKLSFYLLMVVIVVNLNSCSKHDVQLLPPETKTGAGTFACIYNGRTLTYNGGYAYLIFDTLRKTKMLSINGVNQNSFDDMSIGLEVRDPFINGNAYYSFQLNSPFQDANTGGVNLGNGCLYYLTDKLHQGFLEITNLDTIKGIVSGRFSFTAAKYSTCIGFDSNTNNSNNNDVVKVNSGRFDLKLY